MAEWYAGNSWEFDDEQRKVLLADGVEVVVFKHKDRFYALENTCLHMGGPVGEGILIGKVEAVLDENQCYLGERFSESEIHLVCPWHGWEFDIETGQFAGNKRRKLRKYQTEQRGERIYVLD